MMDNSVFDILIYVFDRYVLDELPPSERSTLASDLTSAGFGQANVERALDWLVDLAELQAHATPSTAGSFRIYAQAELLRLDCSCRGLLALLEQRGILSAAQRELVIDRLMALESDDLDLDHVRWVVLMVLSSQSSQPGQDIAYEWMEDLVFDVADHEPH
jgi:Smg protein